MCTWKTSEIRTPPYTGQLHNCGLNGVLIIEVSLYRTVYCGPNGVLVIEVSLYRTVVVPMVSLL